MPRLTAHLGARRPLWAAAVGVVVAELGLAAMGVVSAALSIALLLAPGLALAPLLPERTRRTPLAVLAAAPALGVAASSVALISVASAGAALDPWVVRGVIAAIVAAAGALRGPDLAAPFDRRTALAAVALGASLVVGVLLQERVLGGSPVPGNDWAKYVLYADEIERQRSLLIDNPFWLLGVPFREDPGAPALYGGFLVLTGEPATAVMHGIWLFAVIGILSVYAFVRTLWEEPAALVAAALYAVVPTNQDILGWHGLANVAALALLALFLLYLGELVTRGLRTSACAGLGLVVVAVAAAHRLTFIVLVLTALVVLAAALALARERAPLLRGAALGAGFAALLSAGVAYDLVTRSRTFGGTLSYTAYLGSKVELGPAIADLTVPFVVLGLMALGFGVRRLPGDRRVLPSLALAAVSVGLAFAWVVHLPLFYVRLVYFLPLALAPLVGAGLVQVLGARRGALAGVAVAVAMAAFAWPQAANVRNAYAFVNGASLRGLDAVTAEIRPGDVVVTDRCWSFLSTWLVHEPTLPALDPADIQPKAELARARQAHAVLAGTPRGRALARRLGVRYVLTDPTCRDSHGRHLRPPRVGKPWFVSRRLLVLRL
jgi:Dolichyl-phosphate-mannose-protein mannosyltransferase